MQQDFGILVGITVFGFFILFWLLVFTKQDIRFLNDDVKRLTKTIDKIESNVCDMKHKINRMD